MSQNDALSVKAFNLIIKYGGQIKGCKSTYLQDEDGGLSHMLYLHGITTQHVNVHYIKRRCFKNSG